MDGDVASWLRELEKRLREFGAPVVEAFRPGAPNERVRAALTADGVRAHDDLIAWFGWHDGTDTTPVPPDYDGPGIFYGAENTLVGPWHVISLDDAVRIRRWVRGVNPTLPASWFPVLQFEGQPVLVADADADGDAPLHVVDEGFPEPPPPQFDSIVDFVRTILRLFDEDLIRQHPEHTRAPWFEHSQDAELRRLDSW